MQPTNKWRNLLSMEILIHWYALDLFITKEKVISKNYGNLDARPLPFYAHNEHSLQSRLELENLEKGFMYVHIVV